MSTLRLKFIEDVRKTTFYIRAVDVILFHYKLRKMARPGGNDGGLRGLVDSGASCGTVNPLMRLTTHYTKDRAKLDEGHISTNRKIKTQKQNGMTCD